MDPFTDKPAAVRPAEDLAALFGEGKAHCHSAEVNGRKSLEDLRKAGVAFRRAKALVPTDQWTATVQKQWPGQLRTVQRAMWVAKNWEKVHAAKSLREAQRLATADDAEEPVEGGDAAPKNDTRVVSDSDSLQTDAPNPNGGKRSGGSGGSGGGGGGAPASPPPPPAAPAQPPSGADIAFACRDQAESLVVSLMDRLAGLATGVLGPRLLEALEARGVAAVPVRTPHLDQYGRETRTADRTYRWPQLEAILAALNGLKPGAATAADEIPL